MPKPEDIKPTTPIVPTTPSVPPTTTSTTPKPTDVVCITYGALTTITDAINYLQEEICGIGCKYTILESDIEALLKLDCDDED